MDQRQRNISPVRLSDSPINSIIAPKSAKKPPRPQSTVPTAHQKSKSFEQEELQTRYKYQSFIENEVKPIKPTLKINVQEVYDSFNPIISVGDQSSQKFHSFHSRGSRSNSRDYEQSSNVSSSLNSLNFTTNDNVKVCVRVRPLNEREKSQSKFESCLEIDPISNSIDFTARDSRSTISPTKKQFSYDFVANESIDQEQFFELAAKPIVDSCLNGMNGSIFAYGQTGAGKTYTIQGGSTINLDEQFNQSQDRGILQRSFEHIFAEVESRKLNQQNIGNLDQIFSPKSTGSEQFTLKCSFFEIYNEQIIDLLRNDPKSVSSLKVQETKSKEIEVQGITYKTVTKYEDVLELIAHGTKMRHVGETKMNSQSSRSHSVLSTFINSVSTVNGVTSFKKSIFHIIDLAGSERNKDTQARGDRLKEAGQINKSLSALGNVIKALSSKKKDIGYVPYRSSKLTFILKNSLGGNSKTLIIANISPSLTSKNETVSTLEFAKRAKMMRNQVVVNEDFMSNPNELKKEIERLKLELEKLDTEQHQKNTQTGPFFGCDRCYNLDSNQESLKEGQDLYVFSQSSINDLHCKEVIVESINFTEEEQTDEQRPFNEISEFNEIQTHSAPKQEVERRHSDSLLQTQNKIKNLNELRLSIGTLSQVRRPPMHSTRSMQHSKLAPTPESKKSCDISKSPMGFQLNSFFNLQNIQEELASVNQELQETQCQHSARDDQYQELLSKFINFEKANNELKQANQTLEEENKEFVQKFLSQSQTIQEMQKEKLDKNKEFELYENMLQKENEQIKLEIQDKTQDLTKLEDLIKRDKETFETIAKKLQEDNITLQDKHTETLKDLEEALRNFEDIFQKNEMAESQITQKNNLLDIIQNELELKEDLVKTFKEKEKKLLSQVNQLTTNTKIFKEKTKLLESDKKDLIKKNKENTGRLEQLKKESTDLRVELDQKEIYIEGLRLNGAENQSDSSANGRSNLAMSFLKDDFNSSAQNNEYLTAQKNKNSVFQFNSTRSLLKDNFQETSFRQRSPDSENFSQISKIEQIKSIAKANDTTLRDYNLSAFGQLKQSQLSPFKQRSVASNLKSRSSPPGQSEPSSLRDIQVIDFDTGSPGVENLRTNCNMTNIETPVRNNKKSITQNDKLTLQLDISQQTFDKNHKESMQQHSQSKENPGQNQSQNRTLQLDTPRDRINNTYSCEYENSDTESRLNTPDQKNNFNNNYTLNKQNLQINSTAKKDVFVYDKVKASKVEDMDLDITKHPSPDKDSSQHSQRTKTTTQKILNLYLNSIKSKTQIQNHTVIISNEKIGIQKISGKQVIDKDDSPSQDHNDQTKSNIKYQESYQLKDQTNEHLRHIELQSDNVNDVTVVHQHQERDQINNEDDESGSECSEEGMTTVIIDDFTSPMVYDVETQQQEEVSHFQLTDVVNEQNIDKSPTRGQTSESSQQSIQPDQSIELQMKNLELKSQLEDTQETIISVQQENKILIDSLKNLNTRITILEDVNKKQHSDLQQEVKQSQIQSQIYLQQQKKLELKFKDLLNQKSQLKKDLFEQQNKVYNLMIDNQKMKVGKKISDIQSRKSVQTITPKFGKNMNITSLSQSFVASQKRYAKKSRGSSNNSGVSKNNISMSICSYEMEIKPLKIDKIQDIQDDQSAGGYKTEIEMLSQMVFEKKTLPKHIRHKSGQVNPNMTCDNPLRVSADFSREPFRMGSQRGNSKNVLNRSHISQRSCCQSIHSYREEHMDYCKDKQWAGQLLECQSVPYQETDMRF